MNKILISIGIICSLLWGFVTAMTFGIPFAWCRFIDNVTLHKISREVFQMGNGFYYDVNNNDMPTMLFLVIFFIIFVLIFFLVGQAEKRKCDRNSLLIIIFFSVLFRLILLPGELIHENDIYRYLWDGKSATHGINPFKYAPADLFMYENDIEHDYYDEYNEVTISARSFSHQDSHQLDTLLSLRNENPVFYERIGHWQVPTIYPPVVQMVFTVITFLKKDSVFFMKFCFVLFDLGVLFLIIGLLKYFKKNLSLCLIYGWSPLVLMAIAQGGHYDSIPIFLVIEYF